MHWVIEPGFFSSQPVHVALVIGGAVAVVSAIVGIFTVLRGQSFAGHSLTDVSTAGGSGALLVGVSPLLGFVGFGLLGAGTMDAIGVQRVRGRDLATGVVLGAATGSCRAVAVLGHHLGGHHRSDSADPLRVHLHASIPPRVPIVIAFSLVAIGLIGLLYRPLLLASTSTEIAAARGVPVRLVGLGFMAAMAVAVGLSALAIGAILSTALLIGPAATALRLTRRIGAAIGVAVAIGVVETWLGVLLAYDSFYWGSDHAGFPVSSFIVLLTFAGYLVSGLPWARRLSGRGIEPMGAISGAAS